MAGFCVALLQVGHFGILQSDIPFPGSDNGCRNRKTPLANREFRRFLFKVHASNFDNPRANLDNAALIFDNPCA